MVETNITEILKYLQEREENLSRYSDKLRKAISIIEGQFGEKSRCRICGIYTKGEKRMVYANAAIDTNNPKAQPLINKEIPHDELFSEKYLDILENKKLHKFVPSIDISIDIMDIESFCINEDKKYFLAFNDHSLICIMVDEEYEDKSYYSLSDLSRESLKDLIKSGRLIKFLNYVAEELKKKEQEFKEVSEIAEKMAQAATL